ncbi:hypothetical protein L2E82_22763 [Cichorium intybus]|uniref:Uncharacterized protein n=1 Tax=Cichorium intybus TaxID=13427 RepID=A0ACB9DYN0_CICIN|nr:hypothetical protein L2E82_22763 [Cichorium intybus]
MIRSKSDPTTGVRAAIGNGCLFISFFRSEGEEDESKLRSEGEDESKLKNREKETNDEGCCFWLTGGGGIPRLLLEASLGSPAVAGGV